MYRIRLASPTDGTHHILELLQASDGAVNVSVLTGSGRFPDGDVIECYLQPEIADEVIHALRELDPGRRGPIVVEKVETAVIRSHQEMIKPSVSDREIAPVWEVVDATIRANATYPVSFYLLMVAAGLIAATGILTNSQILVVGAMVVGPEYNAILGAALGITERNRRPVRRAFVALGLGFGLAVIASFLFSLVIHGLGQTPRDYTLGFRPVSDLISQPNLFSVVVAVLAGLVGVISILQSRANALIGVFISVTTIPAAAAMGLSAAFGQWDEAAEATEQLFLNVIILLVVGVAALVVQRRFWTGHPPHPVQTAVGE
jgi:uncharacterized hydrophobic protein (TIGR00271 family)